MNRIAIFIGAIALLIVAAPPARAQDHAEVGVYADYFRLNQTGTNFAGVGARLGINVSHHFLLEGEMNYDFNQTFTEGFDNGTGTVTVDRSNLRVLHGMFGPKLQTGGPVKAFLTVKGGFMNFRFDGSPATVGGFFSSVNDLRSNNVNGVLYPGGGLESFWGPIGLRLDVGDEIYFNNGAQHNLRVSFGPTFRF